MTKFTILFLFLATNCLALKAQNNHITESGYTSLTIRLAGEYPKHADISTPHMANPLSHEKPVQLQVLNDSIYVVSFFTFGPSALYFTYNQQYLNTILLPNHSDTLTIRYDDSTFTTEYVGRFKEIFDTSAEFARLMQSYFTHDYTDSDRRIAKTANFYRDVQLARLRATLDELGSGVQSSILKRYFYEGVEGFYKADRLLVDYEESIQSFNVERGQDSLEATLSIPNRDITYYNGIVEPKLADTLSLMPASYNRLLNSIQKDKWLSLPAVTDVGPNAYRSKLITLFNNTFQRQNNLFYDMMVANGYINYINDGRMLTPKHRADVESFFKNRGITNYILFYDDFQTYSRQSVQASAGRYYLSFDQEETNVMDDILSRYKDKIILVDFWATWCGPCIEAHDRLKKVKELYKDREDVVFVYITDETSDRARWNDYVSAIGGEHYYLYNGQHRVISDHLEFLNLPTYVIFDKQGNRYQQQNSADEIDKRVVSWIDDLSDK